MSLILKLAFLCWPVVIGLGLWPEESSQAGAEAGEGSSPFLSAVAWTTVTRQPLCTLLAEASLAAKLESSYRFSVIYKTSLRLAQCHGAATSSVL